MGRAPGASADAGEERFQLIGTLGEGGMGKVLSYQDRGLERRVAVKIAREKGEDEAAILREARVLGALRHPNIIPVYDLGEDPDYGTFYVMPMLEEPTLRDTLRALREGRATHGRALRIFIQVCQAVAYAHSRGVVHCDLKPENVLLGSYGEVMVADWGFAYRMTDKRAPRGGTAGFMPPEQLMRGGRIDERTDVFALGVMLYQLLTDAYPFPFIGFEEWDAAARNGKHAFPSLVPPSERVSGRNIPADLEEICVRALALEQDDRLSTAQELVQALEGFVEGTKEKRRRERRAGELCEEGEALLTSYRDLLAAHDEKQAEIARLRAPLSPSSDAEQRDALWHAEDASAVIDALTSRTLLAAETALEAALDQVTGHVEATRLLAGLYRDEHRRALVLRDEAAARRYEALALEHDDGSFAALLAGGAGVVVRIADGSVELSLFEAAESGPAIVRGPEVSAPLAAAGERRWTGLPQGRYELVARRGGRELATVPLWLIAGDTSAIALVIPESEAWAIVPAGPALLGGHETSAHGARLHSVEVPAFAIARLPVTVGEYFAFLSEVARADRARAEALLPRSDGGAALFVWDPEGSDPVPVAAGWARDAGDPRLLPIVGIDLAAARAYAAWRGAKEGRALRLPRADEWEKAARGVDGRRFPWGDRFDPTLCKTRESKLGPAAPEPVGTYASDRSPYGVQDLAGGVSEWVEASVGAGWSTIRGGSWADGAMACHAGARRVVAEGDRAQTVGFRLAFELAPG